MKLLFILYNYLNLQSAFCNPVDIDSNVNLYINPADSSIEHMSIPRFNTGSPGLLSGSPIHINDSGDLTDVNSIEVEGDTAISGALTINAGTANAINFPTVKGTSGQTMVSDAAGNLSWAIPSSFTIGDIKQGMIAADHSGWIKLDGRAKSTLTPTQQAAATSLGIGANLPNAADSVLIQNGTALGSVSGSMSKTIAQANLPSYNLTASSSGAHTHTGSGTTSTNGNHQHASNGQTGGAQQNFENFSGLWYLYANIGIDGYAYNTTKYLAAAAGDHTHTYSFTTSSDGAHTHTVPSGGSGTAFDVTPKSLSVNTFLYLGP